MDKKQNDDGQNPELDQEKARTAALEGELKALADDLTQDVPEDMRDLIPDLPPSERVKWIRAALKKGFFKKAPTAPDSKRPTGKKPADLGSMSPLQRISHGLAARK